MNVNKHKALLAFKKKLFFICNVECGLGQGTSRARDSIQASPLGTVTPACGPCTCALPDAVEGTESEVEQLGFEQALRYRGVRTPPRKNLIEDIVVA